MFHDRSHAGKELAKALRHYRGEVVVIALPRGGVILGREVARSLHAPLDIRAVRKVGHPGNPEYALCAIDEYGNAACMEEAEAVDQRWLAAEKLREQKEAVRRSSVYRGARPPLSLAGRTVVLVDDGVATGLTMLVAIRAARKEGAKRVVVAVPVAPEDSAHTLRREADEVVLLEPASEFLGAVGAHYETFPQVGDEEVVRALESAHLDSNQGPTA